MFTVLTYPADSLDDLFFLLKQEGAVYGPSPLGPEHLRDRLPTKDQLKTLLDTCFFASLRQEEGRPVRFRLAFFQREKAEALGCERFTFDTPLAFEPAQLTKLAPALDPNASYILVEPGNDGNLRIWGIIYYDGPTPPDILNKTMPVLLNIVVQRPGIMTLRFSNTCFSFRYALGQGTLPRIGSAPERINALTTPLLDFSTIQGIGISMLEQGHGGTVLVLPAEAPTPASVTFPKYKAAVPCDVLRNRARAAEAKGRGGVPAELEHAYRLVGALTAVDGAVVLDSALNVRGFGAIVERQEATESRQREILDESGERYELALRGTRHRSAVTFCQSCESALALVVSQDGATSLFVTRPGFDAIFAVRDIHAYWRPF
jgi:hypothetical protein